MIGPGKYDRACRVAIDTTDADALLLVVVNGRDGSGISLAIDEKVMDRHEAMRQLPAFLHALADSITEDDELKPSKDQH